MGVAVGIAEGVEAAVDIDVGVEVAVAVDVAVGVSAGNGVPVAVGSDVGSIVGGGAGIGVGDNETYPSSVRLAQTASFEAYSRIFSESPPTRSAQIALDRDLISSFARLNNPPPWPSLMRPL